MRLKLFSDQSQQGTEAQNNCWAQGAEHKGSIHVGEPPPLNLGFWPLDLCMGVVNSRKRYEVSPVHTTSFHALEPALLLCRYYFTAVDIWAWGCIVGEMHLGVSQSLSWEALLQTEE